MSIKNIIKERRSVRSFTSQSISDEKLFELLEVAAWAPSHGNEQPWEFVVLGDATRKGFTENYQKFLENGPLQNPELPEPMKAGIRKFAENFGNAARIVVAASRPATNPLEEYDYPLTVAAAIQNLFLAAWEEGIGGVWLSYGIVPQVAEYLKLPEGAKIHGVLALGYPEAVPPAQERAPIKDKIIILP